ncbi:MAG: hypothetical protein KKB50_09940 [Planctomycetes bacterium]|nr:hypothetical protein [Planctomycetota bacterium]
MSIMRLILGGSLCLGLLLFCGCGKTEEPPTRFNRTLGDGAQGAPVLAAATDTGILRDQAGYQPAAYAGSRGAAGAGGAAGGGDAATEVRDLIEGALKALLDGDIDTAVAAFNPEHLGTLAEDPSVIYDAFEKFEALCGVIEDKTGENPLTAARDGLGQALNALVIDVLDGENVSVALDMSGLAAMARGLLPGVALPGAGAAGEAPSIRVSKQDDNWRIQLPEPLTEEQIRMAAVMLEVAGDFFDKFGEKLETAEVDFNDRMQVQMLAMQTFMESPELMQKIMEAGLPLGPGGVLPGTPTGAPEEDEEAEPEKDEADKTPDLQP